VAADAAVFSYMVRTYPQGFAQLLSVKGACVTGLASASPVLYDEEPEPPSSGRSPAQEPRRNQFPAIMLRHCPTLPCHFERSEAEPRNLRPSSFLPPCSTTAPCRMGNYPPIVSCRHAPPMVPSRTGNYPQTVSCHYAPPLFHAGQETFRNQFPAAMLRQCPMPDRKLFANSFLPPCSTTAPRRTRNYPPIVSCRHAPPLPHAGWETIEKRL